MLACTHPLPLGRDEPVEAVDHDRGPPPAPACRQEHGLREILKYGTGKE